ncbi:ATP-grasp domain-containing protein [Pararhodonellum marinum]|uniref:ATP-grasp domain-containing protein n=1 Tax=Pararhodonellum marinum TaxID=2755358 RepID=UPI00188FF19B|nr:hypothetical protein [Pararhodonellum marinum]
MIGISNSDRGFNPIWIKYCEANGIPFKKIDCYSNEVMHQLHGCKALMWHHSHSHSKDIVMAKQLLNACQQAGITVFPDFNTAWHFDDKVGQKYLLEAIQAPIIPSFVFYEKETALKWIMETTFPKVFKLRGGASAANVRLVKNSNEAQDIVNKAFGSGFKQYNAFENLQERWRKFRKGKGTLTDLAKGVARIYQEPEFSKTMGKERGYVYFQEFLPNNGYDIRLIVIGKKAYGMKRLVRKNDFRASGSTEFEYGTIDDEVLKIAFDVAARLRLQTVAFDFIYNEEQKPMIVELSYGFGTTGSSKCKGYWDQNLFWHEGEFNPQGWMVDLVSEQMKNDSNK